MNGGYIKIGIDLNIGNPVGGIVLGLITLLI